MWLVKSKPEGGLRKPLSNSAVCPPRHGKLKFYMRVLEILLPTTWRTLHILDVTLFWSKLLNQERVYNHYQNLHVPFPQRSQTPCQGNIPRCVTVYIPVATVMSPVTCVKRPGHQALCLFSRVKSFFIHSVVLTEVLQSRRNKKIPVEYNEFFIEMHNFLPGNFLQRLTMRWHMNT